MSGSAAPLPEWEEPPVEGCPCDACTKARSVATTPDAVLRDFTDYIADLVTSGIASRDGCPDFVIALPEDNRRAYFDVEAQEVFVITVERGRIEVGS